MSQKTFLTLPLILVVLSSCIKRYGCMESSALNFDSKASFSDESCIYKSQGIFYWTSWTVTKLALDGITHLTIVLDQEKIASGLNISTLSVNESNDCTNTFWPHFEKVIYNGGYQNAHLEILDQNDSIFYSEIIQLKNGCQTYQFNY